MDNDIDADALRSPRAQPLLLLALGVGLTLCTACDEETVIDPVNVCRCSPDQICINESCQNASDVRIIDATGSDASRCEEAVVIIDEVRFAGETLPDFIELSGEPGTALDGWFIRSFEADGTRRTTVELAGALDESGRWVASFGAGLEARPDLDYGSDFGVIGFAAPTGSVVLYDCGGGEKDAVGYGSFDAAAGDVFLGEGDPAPTTAPDRVLARCPDAEDTDDNATDFIEAQPTPDAANPTCDGGS